MTLLRHPKHNYRISRITGKRLPSRAVLHRKIREHHEAIERLNRLLDEHKEVSDAR